MSNAAEADHYLYVIEFTDRVVKVGRTCRLDARFSEHKADAKKIGQQLRRAWISFCFTEAVALRAEALLISRCKAKWPLAQGMEFFAADFMDIVGIATEIDEANLAARAAA